MVLDFANSAEEILEAFKPYYEKTLLSEGTDPNLLYDCQSKLLAFNLYTEAEVDRFAAIFFDPKANQAKLYAVLEPIVERYTQVSEDEKADFRSQLTDYVRLFAFLSQIISFTDSDLAKLYEFARLLLRRLPRSKERLPIEIQQNMRASPSIVLLTTCSMICSKATLSFINRSMMTPSSLRFLWIGCLNATSRAPKLANTTSVVWNAPASAMYRDSCTLP